ncbi:SIR2 family protein [Dokdonella sp. MW10]|uniref:SIR2 family protein n=1 Tax=Dokdonella sp. MW10 TaxID=2992926 RepID=UPI003F7CE25B
MPIPVQPKTPRELVTAVAAGSFVPFIGSGISSNCGSPTWREFADRAAQQALERKLVTQEEYDVLVNPKLPPRTALSVIAQREGSRGLRLNYTSILHPEGMDYPLVGRRILAALSRMASTFVTTNYDRWLDQRIVDLRDSDHHLRENVRTAVFDRSTFSPSQLLLDNTVIHLHGRCTEPSSMIVTTVQYLEHYRSYRPENEGEGRLQLLLRSLFRDKCVIFMGYGLAELEILEFVMQKGLPTTDHNSKPRHFILMPFEPGEEVRADLLGEYFQSFGVGLMPYLIENGDHSPIADVLERLADSLPTPRRPEIEIERQLQRLGGDI